MFVKKETYNLICKGELAPGFEPSTVIPQIAKLFKVDETKAKKILDKTPRVLKKQVSWEQAVKYKQKLKSIGLVIDLNLAFDADIFRESMVTVNQPVIKNQGKVYSPPEVNDNKKVPLQLLSVDITHLVPAMLASAHSETLFDGNETPKFQLESYNHWLNPKFLLLVSLFTALIIQKYFGLLLVQATTSAMITPLLILLFILITVFLPKVMSIRRVFTLRNINDNSAYAMCTQISGLNPFVDEYLIYSGGEELLAWVKLNKLKSKIECFDIEGNVLFSSAEEQYVDGLTKEVATEIRDELFDFSMLSYLNMFNKGLKKLKTWIKKEKQLYQRNDAFVVRDSNMNKIAYFHRRKTSVIEFSVYPDKGNENKTLIVFLLMCLGVA